MTMLLLKNRSLLILGYVLMFRDFYFCPELIASKQYFVPNAVIYSLNATVYWNCALHSSISWCEISVFTSLFHKYITSCDIFFVFQDMPNNDRQTYFSDESLTRDIYSNWIKGFLAIESQQNLSYTKKLCNFQTWSKVKVHWFCTLEEIHFFTKG